MKFNIIGTVAFILLSGQLGYSQVRNDADTIIPNQTIKIYQDYTPEIPKLEKPNWSPSLPPIDTTKPLFNYLVPQQSLSYTYHSVPIRPLAMGREDLVIPFQNYVKAGFGNLGSLLLDAGIGLHHEGLYESQIHFYHLSQRNGGIVDRQSSNTNLDASGQYFWKDFTFNGGLSFFRNGLTYYGYDHEIFSFEKDQNRQVFYGADITLGGENTKPMWEKIFFSPKVNFGFIQDKFNNAENTFGIQIPASWHIDSSLSLNLGINAQATHYDNGSAKFTQGMVGLAASLKMKLESTLINIGAQPTIGANSKFYLLPDLNIKWMNNNNRLALLAGWKAELQQNSFKNLTRKNPFILALDSLTQTKTDKIYAGFESALGNHVTFSGVAGFQQWTNMPLFVNNYTFSPDGRRFKVLHDPKVQALTLDAAINYQMSSKFEIGAAGTWYNFIKKTDKVWHEPMLQLNGFIRWKPIEALHLNFGVSYWDGMYYQNEAGEHKVVPVFLDMNAGGEYALIDRLSLFLQFNNIVGGQYQRWNQYQNYGINVIGGLRFKF